MLVHERGSSKPKTWLIRRFHQENRTTMWNSLVGAKAETGKVAWSLGLVQEQTGAKLGFGARCGINSLRAAAAFSFRE